MRHDPNLRAQKFKQPDPKTGQVYSDVNGSYRVKAPTGAVLTVIASDGLGWDHVSVSLPFRCPTWDEMAFVKDLFWRHDETVMQLHVPVDRHVNVQRFCLHLWRPQDQDIPQPHLVMV